MAMFNLISAATSSNYTYRKSTGNCNKKYAKWIFDGAEAKVLNTNVSFAVNDVVNVLAASEVPAGAVVYGVGYKVLQAEGGTCTVALGDDADATGYFGSSTVINGNTLGADGSSFVNSTSANAYGKGKISDGTNCGVNIKLISGTMDLLRMEVSIAYYTDMTQFVAALLGNSLALS
jgi:hypothetical protein